MSVLRSDVARDNIVCKSFQRVIKEGKRLRIIKLENYNSAKELLIKKEDTESLGLI